LCARQSHERGSSGSSSERSVRGRQWTVGDVKHMRRVSPGIESVIEPVVSGLGYEFVGAQFGQAENGQTLRVYIDTENGVVVEDCVAVSKQLSAVLDVEDTIKSAYQLEVSSPGIDRPLFNATQFAQQVNEVVKVKMAVAVDGRRNFKGQLVAVEGDEVIIEVDGIDYTLPVNDIEEAYMLANLSKSKSGSSG